MTVVISNKSSMQTSLHDGNVLGLLSTYFHVDLFHQISRFHSDFSQKGPSSFSLLQEVIGNIQGGQNGHVQ